MSKDQKNIEENCLKKSIEAGLQQRNFTKFFCKRLSNAIDVSRGENEKPDFVKCINFTDKKYDSTILGIEHFRVDHLSKEIKGKIQSTGVFLKKDIDQLYKVRRKEILKGEIDDQTIGDINEVICKHFERKQTTNYNIFIQSFQYSLEKHIDKISKYRENIKKLVGSNKKIELAFLIEIHADFSNHLLVDKNGVRRCKDHIPLFRDIVNILKNIEKKKIDYIILDLESKNFKKTKTIVLRNKNIEKQLQQQKVTIYEYAGIELYSLDENIKLLAEHEIKNGMVNFNYQFSIDNDMYYQKIKKLFPICKKAYHYFNNHINYVTVLPIQYFVEVFNDYINGWEEKDEKEIVPIFKNINYLEINDKILKFNQKWDADSNI